MKEGPRAESAKAKREAVKAGITDKMLRHTRGKLGVIIGYEGMPAKSVWSLPDQVADNDGTDSASRAQTAVSDDQGAQQEEITPPEQVNADVPSPAHGHNRAHQSSAAEIDHNPPVVPLTTDTHGVRAQQPPGAPTENTHDRTCSTNTGEQRAARSLRSVRGCDSRAHTVSTCARYLFTLRR